MVSVSFTCEVSSRDGPVGSSPIRADHHTAYGEECSSRCFTRQASGDEEWNSRALAIRGAWEGRRGVGRGMMREMTSELELEEGAGAVGGLSGGDSK